MPPPHERWLQLTSATSVSYKAGQENISIHVSVSFIGANVDACLSAICGPKQTSSTALAWKLNEQKRRMNLGQVRH